jgi:hypothetical protein
MYEVYIHIRTYVFLYLYTYIHAHRYMHTYIYTYIHTITCIHGEEEKENKLCGLYNNGPIPPTVMLRLQEIVMHLQAAKHSNTHVNMCILFGGAPQQGHTHHAVGPSSCTMLFSLEIAVFHAVTYANAGARCAHAAYITYAHDCLACVQLASTRQTMLPPSDTILAIALESETCSDYDECELGISSCAPNRTCANTFGSFVCPSCNRGFESTDGLCLGKCECSVVFSKKCLGCHAAPRLWAKSQNYAFM